VTPATFDGGQDSEARRILTEYRRRQSVHIADRYAPDAPGALFEYQQRIWRVLEALRRSGYLPLSTKRILDVGCGAGRWLLDLEALGARRDRLAGVDLSLERVAAARERLGAASGGHESPDIRVGDACSLPWDTGSFDLVFQQTMLSSILDQRVRMAAAAEMVRVLRRDGAIISYDLRVNNPFNRAVRGISTRELRRLFPDMHLQTARVTLIPQLARATAGISRLLPTLLESSRVLNGHCLATITRRAGLKA
jgi:SAM-dependent methyltransferase